MDRRGFLIRTLLGLLLLGLALLLAGVFGVSVEALFEIDQEEQHE